MKSERPPSRAPTEGDPQGGDPRGARRRTAASLAGLLMVALAAGTGISLLSQDQSASVRRYPSVSLEPAISNSPRPGLVTPEEFGAIGDGQHDDGPAVQAALDAARGRVVKLRAGTTYLSRQALLLPSYTTVEGPRSAVLAFTWVDTSQSDSGGPFYLGNSDQRAGNVDITLDGFSVHGAGSGLPRGPNLAGQTWSVPALRLRHVNTFILRDLDVGFAPSISILYQGCIHGLVEDSHVHDSGRDGITGTWLDGDLADITVANNTIERVGDDGIAIAGATVGTQNNSALPTDIRILRNRIIGWTLDPNGMIIGRGIALLAVTNVKVQDNTVDRTAGPGLLLTGSPTPNSVNPIDGARWLSSRVLITGNRITQAGLFATTSILPAQFSGGGGLVIMHSQLVTAQRNDVSETVVGDPLLAEDCASCHISR